MTDPEPAKGQEKRGELTHERMDEAAEPDAPPRPNEGSKEQSRRNPDGRTGSESNAG